MSIKHAILGFLSWQPKTGYELKKLFAESPTFYWSGNNNQIYKALVDLHEAGLVSQTVEQQERLPARKIYTITEQGRAELRQWITSTPEPPQVKNTFLVQLAWADQLANDELDALLAQYEEEVAVHGMMMRTHQGRRVMFPDRTPREAWLWDRIMENWANYYDHELEWVRSLRAEIRERSGQ